jgi:YidC/Oxa1 family membrane protein insertase
LSKILAPIDDVVAWIITRLFNLFGPIFGDSSGATWVLTIVVLVVIMRLILLPLFIKQMHTQRAMTALTPKITELRKRYKNDREKLNQETMKLYQEAGVNPLMGCLPLLLQMPIFFGLFSVLEYIAKWTPKLDPGSPSYHLKPHLIQSALHAKILGATIADKVLFTDGLHVPVEAKIVILIAVVISMTTTYLTVRQSMKRGMMPTGPDNPMGQSQKLMMYVMPLFALTGLYWQFGLVLYWVTTNVWTLGQQFVILRRYPVGAAAAAAGGNLPIAGRGKPATAAGLTSATGRTRPGAGSGQGKSRPATGGSGKVSGTASEDAGDSGAAQEGVPADVQDAVPGKRQGAAAGKPQGSTAGRPTAGQPRTAGAGRPSGGAAGRLGGAASGKSSGGAGRTAGASTNGKAGGSGAKAPGRPAGSKPAQPGRSSEAGRSPSAAKPARAGTSGVRPGGTGNGHSPGANDGGPLRRFTRRFEPEPEPTVELEPEVRIVRNQPQRQSRSKRSGKR